MLESRCSPLMGFPEVDHRCVSETVLTVLTLVNINPEEYCLLGHFCYNLKIRYISIFGLKSSITRLFLSFTLINPQIRLQIIIS